MCHNYWTIFHIPTQPPHQSEYHHCPINPLFIITNLQIIKTLCHLHHANHPTVHHCNQLILRGVSHAYHDIRVEALEIFTKPLPQLNFFYYICVIFSVHLWSIFPHVQNE